MRTAWFPGWEVNVDGHRFPRSRDAEWADYFSFCQGDHAVDVRYGQTLAEKEAAGVDIASLILAILLGVGARRKERRRSSQLNG
jgi:hypothetical protein